MARISLSQMFNSGLRGILNVQAQTLKTQNQIATGKRVLTPSDDPVAAAQILRLEQDQKGIVQYQKNIDAVENNLMLEETQLDAVTNLLTRVRELAVRAGNGAQTASERKALASELSTRLDELYSLANTRNTSGEYIFGGSRGSEQPFTRAGGLPDAWNFTYGGDAGNREVMISDSTLIRMGDNGGRIFTSVPTASVSAESESGEGYIFAGQVRNQPRFDEYFDKSVAYTVTIDVNRNINLERPDGDGNLVEVTDEGGDPVLSGTLGEDGKFEIFGVEFRIAGEVAGSYTIGPATQHENILNTVAELAHKLSTLGDDTELEKWKLEDIVATTLNRLDNAEAHIGAVRAEVGARLNTLDSTRELHSGVSLVNDKILKEIRDLDYAEAITRLTQEDFVLKAAQQSFAKISGLSLFNFLR